MAHSRQVTECCEFEGCLGDADDDYLDHRLCREHRELAVARLVGVAEAVLGRAFG